MKSQKSVVVVLCSALGVLLCVCIRVSGGPINNQKSNTPEEVVAKRFRVVGNDGETQVVVGDTGLGPGVTILDKDGEPGVRISIAPNGNRLIWLINPKDKTTLELRVDDDAWLRLGKKGKVKVVKP